MEKVRTMADYMKLPALRCTTCGHWGRGIKHTEESPCAGLIPGTPDVCLCTRGKMIPLEPLD